MSKLVDIEGLKAFREKLDERYVIEGEYSPSTRVGNSDYADNLTPYSPNSGVYQAIPYNFQGTGCGNGETQVDTGSFCQFKEKRGNGIVYNQLLNATVSTTVGGVSSACTINHIVMSGTATSSANFEVANINIINGHKYIVFLDILKRSVSSPTVNAFWQLYKGSPFVYVEVAENKSNPNLIFTANATTTPALRIRVENGNTYDYDFYFVIADLTKWFNGNIPQYLLDHPESFFRYYSGDLSYNTGEVRFSNARYLKTYGRNQWDEEWEVGSYNQQTGEKIDGTTNVRCKNPIRCTSNTTYYFRSGNTVQAPIIFLDKNGNFISIVYKNNNTFTTPSNAYSFVFFMYQSYGSIYNNDITISIYYDGESGYTDYYPFEQLQEVDTGTEQLYQAGSAYDRKGSNGLIERNIGSVDLGDLTWTKTGADSGGHYAYYSDVVTQFKETGIEEKTNIICARYLRGAFTNIRWSNYGSWYSIGNCITLYSNNHRFYIYDSAFDNADATGEQLQSALDGVLAYVELATSTTEQGTPFTESVKIDDFGSMSLESANGVPQGNLIFYPVDYKAFEDSLINRTNGDVTNIPLKSDIVQELPDAPSTDGTYVLKATVSSGAVSYEWVEEGA